VQQAQPPAWLGATAAAAGPPAEAPTCGADISRGAGAPQVGQSAGRANAAIGRIAVNRPQPSHS
jgi:hypothetical protein